jgi:hypothetical protein
MLQTVDGYFVFVVDFDTMPALPITWNNSEEEPYARALQAAIQDGVITEPGKYGIQIEHKNQTTTYTIHSITE